MFNVWFMWEERGFLDIITNIIIGYDILSLRKGALWSLLGFEEHGSIAAGRTEDTSNVYKEVTAHGAVL